MIQAIIENKKIYFGNREVIHINHGIPSSIKDIEEDVWDPYLVFESCTNYPLVHGIMAESEYHAMEQVNDTLAEGETIIGCNQLNFKKENNGMDK